MQFAEFLGHWRELDRSVLYLYAETKTGWAGLPLPREAINNIRREVVTFRKELQTDPDMQETLRTDTRKGESAHTVINDAMNTALYESVEAGSYRDSPNFVILIFNAAEQLATASLLKIDDIQAVHVRLRIEGNDIVLDGRLVPDSETGFYPSEGNARLAAIRRLRPS